jgi:hypothetical protein
MFDVHGIKPKLSGKHQFCALQENARSNVRFDSDA